MSLLIKALKKAELRHQEATQQAIEMAATDPGFQAATASQPDATPKSETPKDARKKGSESAELTLQSDQREPTIDLANLETMAFEELTDLEAKYLSLAKSQTEHSPPVSKLDSVPMSASVPTCDTDMGTRRQSSSSAQSFADTSKTSSDNSSPIQSTASRQARRVTAPIHLKPASTWKRIGSVTMFAVTVCGGYLGWQLMTPNQVIPNSIPQGLTPTAKPQSPSPTLGQTNAPKLPDLSDQNASLSVETERDNKIPRKRAARQDGTVGNKESSRQAYLEKLISRIGPNIETTHPNGKSQDSQARVQTEPQPGFDARAEVPSASRTLASNPSAQGSTLKQGPRLIRNEANDRVNQLLDHAFAAVGRHDRRAARQLYGQVLEIERTNTDALNALASLSAREGDSNAAERFYGRVLELDPSDSAARAGLASLRVAVDPTGQESQLRHLLAGNSAQPSLQFALGNSLAAQSRWNEAQQAYFLASNGDAQQPDYAFNLAISLERLHQTRLALIQYRRAFELSKNRPGRFSTEQVQNRIQSLELRLSPQSVTGDVIEPSLTKD
jgi:tetratricopeptide (TPR) repeat protein